MKRFKSILIVAVIFASGIFVGAVVGSSAAIVDIVNKTFRGGPLSVRRILIQRARQDLKLDEDQGHQFWQIINETGVELRDAVQPMRPKLDAILTKSAERLRAVLRPEQQPKFDSFVKEATTRWQAALGESHPRTEGAGTATIP
jgi:hypothetical protein